MGFQRALGTPFLKWFPVDSAAGTPDVIYVGQLVYLGSDGAIPIAAAAGAADTTGKIVPLGIVNATSNRTAVYNTTYKTNQITGADTQALQAARDNVGLEGMFVKGDKQAMVQVDIIDACTWISGPIYKTSHGTAIDVLTAGAGDTDGLMTANVTMTSCTFTPVADKCTIFCRTGANAGLYRTTIDTSTTAPAVDTALPSLVVSGDTFVRVPLVIGQSYAQFDTESMFIDGVANPATDYYVLDVIELNLATAGKETALFRFNADHFCLKRA